MFANIGQENPAKRIFAVAARPSDIGPGDLISFLSILFEKHDVPPGRCAEVAGVVVRISRPREAVVRHLVPFLACDFACFAADANARVGEESDLDVIAARRSVSAGSCSEFLRQSYSME